jgi:hypothetical protein
MSPARINLSELPADVRRKLPSDVRRKLRAPARRSMTMDQVRTAAIRVLAVVADLRPADRARVLKHAAKLNEV